MHAQLVVTYSPEAPPSAPARLFVKRPKPQALAAAEDEARFYRTLAPRMPAIPLVPWYGVGPTAAGTPCLLLADVSATHRPQGDGPLPGPHLEAMVAVLARVHARWWEDAGLVETIAEDPQATVAAMFAGADARYAELVARLGDHLTADHRRILERYLARAPALFRERVRTGTALTLSHPDNHHANFLFPRRPEGPPYLIDWHVYRRWWGPGDLAALVSRSATPEQQRRGDALVRGYHARLIEHGVTGYPWAACWRDYRLGVIATLRVILSLRRHPTWAIRNLTAIMPEFERRGCAELLA